MNAIASINQKRYIGKNGGLLYHIKDDMMFFREKTINNIVIMGRTTFESFPGRKPLKDRTNIVLTRDPEFKVNDDAVVIIHDLKELEEKVLNRYDSDKLWVIGGASIYEQLLKYCNHVYLTHIFDNQIGDAKFPELDAKHWMISSASDIHIDPSFGLQYAFNHYIRY